MRRRDVVALPAALAAVSSFPVRAQQREIPVVGFLHSGSPAEWTARVNAFRGGLAEAGHVDGKTVRLEYRWAEGRFDRFPELAAELVRQRVSVIATPGSSVAALAAKAATTTIPIVFAVPEDPVRLGLVSSLSRPGGNATGVNFFTAEVVQKRLGLLRELVPRAGRVAVLVNPSDFANAESTMRDVETAAGPIGLQIQFLNAATAGEIDAAFAALARDRPDALFVGPGGFFFSRRVQLATLAARHAIPTTYSVREYAEAGGLMSYGTDVTDAFRLVGVYCGRILIGAKPADLPVVQATKFELVINLQTARTLGLDVPSPLLALADEVIE